LFIKDSSKAVVKEIKTGIQDDSYIEITEGLDGKEQIITGPYNTISKELKAGDNVKIADKNAKKKKGKEEEETKE